MKRILTLVLSLVLVLSLTSVAFAADMGDYKLYPLEGAENYYDNARPKDVSYFAIVDSGFDASATDIAAELLAHSVKWDNDFRKSNIDVRVTAKKGNNAFGEAEVGYSKADDQPIKGMKANDTYVKVTLTDKFVSTNTADYEFDIKLSYNRRVERDSYNWGYMYGTIDNYMTEIYEGEDYVDLEGNPLLHAHDYIRSAEVNLGNGVVIKTRLFKDKYYYGISEMDITDKDFELMNKYPQIVMPYNLTTIGLGTGNVYLDTGAKLFAYGLDTEGKLVYVGMTNEWLPYATKYYVAEKELPLEETPTEGPAIDETPTDQTPGMGGDDMLPNINQNPPTGR